MKNDVEIRAEFAAVIDELVENGFRVALMSQEVDLAYNSLSGFRSHGYAPADIGKLSRFLTKKARLLRSYSPSKHSLEYICKETLLKQSAIARRMGISKQGLNKFSLKIPEAREEQLKIVVRSIGETIDTLANRLEKIKE